MPTEAAEATDATEAAEATDATERSNQPEIDTKHAAKGSPASRAASRVPSPSRPPQESPLTATRPGSASPDTSPRYAARQSSCAAGNVCSGARR